MINPDTNILMCLSPFVLIVFIASLFVLLFKLLTKNKLNLKLWTSLLIISFFVFSFTFVGGTFNKIKSDYKYSISINVHDNSNYSIILPVVITDDNIHPIMNDLKIDGNYFSFAFINTSYGHGLMINGSGNLNLSNIFDFKGYTSIFKSREKINPYYYQSFSLSMRINENRFSEEYSIYFNSTNSISLKLNIVHSEMYRGLFYSLNTQISTKGWQEVKIDTKQMIAN